MDNVFSPTENRVLKLLSNDKPIRIDELAKKYFKNEELPLEPNAVVSSAIIRINKKCKYHKLDWFINSYGLGRAGKTVWKDKI